MLFKKEKYIYIYIKNDAHKNSENLISLLKYSIAKVIKF